MRFEFGYWKIANSCTMTFDNAPKYKKVIELDINDNKLDFLQREDIKGKNIKEKRFYGKLALVKKILRPKYNEEELWDNV